MQVLLCPSLLYFKSVFYNLCITAYCFLQSTFPNSLYEIRFQVYFNNVSRNSMYASGTIATLICENGYMVMGRSVSYCQGGTWSPWPGFGSCQPRSSQQYPTASTTPPGACYRMLTTTNGKVTMTVIFIINLSLWSQILRSTKSGINCPPLWPLLIILQSFLNFRKACFGVFPANWCNLCYFDSLQAFLSIPILISLNDF